MLLEISGSTEDNPLCAAQSKLILQINSDFSTIVTAHFLSFETVIRMFLLRVFTVGNL